MESGIALCRRKDNTCLKKDECLRYTEVTGEFDFVNFEARLNTDNGFDCFWSNGILPVIVENETKAEKKVNDTVEENA